MSTKDESLRQVSALDGTHGAQDAAPSVLVLPAPKPPRYTYLLPNKARWAMEAVVVNRRKSRDIMRDMRTWETQQKEGMAELDRMASELSDLDHRKAPLVALVKSLRINLPEIGGLIADVSMLNNEDESTLTEQLTHGRRELDAPPEKHTAGALRLDGPNGRSSDGHADEQNGGNQDGHGDGGQQTRGGP